MKFCGNCGTQMNDEERFCPACGADTIGAQNAGQQQQGAAQPYSQPMYTYDTAGQQQNVNQPYSQPVYGQQPTASPVPANIMKKLPIIAAAAVVVVILAIFFFRCVVGSGSLTMKGAVNNYYKAVETGKGKKIVDACLSNPMLNAICEEEDMTRMEVRKELEADYDEYSVKIDYRKIKIEDKEKYDKEDVKELNEDCKDSTDINPHIKKMYEVEVSYEYRYYSFGEWSDWQERTETITTYKSNGNWYVLPDSIF